MSTKPVHPAKPPTNSASSILGPHPQLGTWAGDLWDHADSGAPATLTHRALSARSTAFPAALAPLRNALTTHHASPDQLKNSSDLHAIFAKLGRPVPKALRRFPLNDTTRKGNFAEVVLAEYIVASSKAQVPVYRLRHNPNVDQSMKGDDVLAFDLNATPARIIVGEAKFRGVSAQAVVTEIIDALESSSAIGIPASLQFAAEHTTDPQLAARIMGCARLFAEGRIRLDYVGMLVSDINAGARVAAHPPTTLRQLLMISWGMNQPEALVDACFTNLG